MSITDIEKEYKEATEFLFSQLPMFSRVGAPAYKPGLETSLNLDKYFSHPHKRFKSIHIGGTNGKGSTSHMLASILQKEGYKTALYTSPHLVDFRERMKINGEMIPKEKVIEFVKEWKRSNYEGKPSFFELTMMMAFDWFAKENVDFAVIEVGMGGRLDSTNIITPLLSIITNISHDHNQFLGDTLEQIAAEKAGIIKPGVPVLIGEKQKETSEVFIYKANREGTTLSFAEEIADTIIYPDKKSAGWLIKYKGYEIKSPLGGEYQKKNITTVLGAVKLLQEIIPLSEESVKKGIEDVIKTTGLKGRWSIISTNPLTIADTGHNIGGLAYNFSQLSQLMEERPGATLRIIIGFVADKAIDKILNLLPEKAVYYVTKAQIPRAFPAEKLYEKFEKQGLESRCFSDVKNAYETAIKEATDKDIIYIGGSTFIVADLFEYLKI